jgi:hypothetical protein
MAATVVDSHGQPLILRGEAQGLRNKGIDTGRWAEMNFRRTYRGTAPGLWLRVTGHNQSSTLKTMPERSAKLSARLAALIADRYDGFDSLRVQTYRRTSPHNT